MICDTCQYTQQHLVADLYRCSRCDLVSSEKKGNFSLYNTEYLSRYKQYAESPLGKAIVNLRLEQVRKYVPDGSTLLDYGCGAGNFVVAAAESYKTAGFDINPLSSWNCSDVFLMPWDVVTFWDSLEHTNSPRAVISTLSPKFLYIAVPCTDDFPGEDLTQWKHYRPNEHVHYYSERAMRRFIEQIGYDILDVNFFESQLRKGFNGKNIMTIIGKKNWRNKDV